MDYKQYNKWAQEQYNALPIYYAFGQKQFDEMLKEHFNGITLEQAKTELLANGYGGYYRRSDAERINNTIADVHDTRERLIKEDATGDGFIYEMFLTELNDHEFIYTQDVTETLDALNITIDDLNDNPALNHGLTKAIREINENDN